ncbi:glycosyltransferase [Stratiformator vulcanicus]|uniref:D-inositol 3-phosphate glycosyltransferase n=1 Tax=Stratiformator vulcanicus TaxID=2527980 RepID=A0A517QWP5_9PLAN|nr:glycosyltransferase [Stratiformator vulcanicus]QDT35988.1 D-inositol 3-phosphate glycosyltransferase [Stratiformator vulcanicus]
MKVLVVNNMAPFIRGGAEELAIHLERNLIEFGHEAEILRVPFQWEPFDGIPSQMLLARTLELVNTDRIIALKFPAYLIRHPEKTIWLLHQYRQAYDLYDLNASNIPTGQEGDHVRDLIKNADNETFREAREIYTNSAVTRDRLRHYNGFDAEILLPPVNDPEAFSEPTHGDYIFAGGRVNSMKRQHLLLEALTRTESHVRLIIGGPPEDPAYAERLKATVADHGLVDRVKLDLRFLPREVYADYVKHAAAVAYLPVDEDSLGYVAMEAAVAAKALITVSDSGGILELVKPGQTGWVAEPDAEAVAHALSSVYKKPKTTRSFGDAAKQLWEGFGINWPHTVEALLK